jgi:hypothetical protein
MLFILVTAAHMYLKKRMKGRNNETKDEIFDKQDRLESWNTLPITV